jgi:hypothetical protein
VFSNRQSSPRGPRASARHHRCTNRSGRSARLRFGRAAFQPRREPAGSTLQSTGATRPPFGGLFAEPSDRFPQADPVRHFPFSIFDFPASAVAFLIRYQQLEFNVNHSKQSTEAISNPQISRCLGTTIIAPPASRPPSCGQIFWGAAALSSLSPSPLQRPNAPPSDKSYPAEAGRYRRNCSCLAFMRRDGVLG